MFVIPVWPFSKHGGYKGPAATHHTATHHTATHHIAKHHTATHHTRTTEQCISELAGDGLLYMGCSISLSGKRTQHTARMGDSHGLVHVAEQHADQHVEVVDFPVVVCHPRYEVPRAPVDVPRPPHPCEVRLKHNHQCNGVNFFILDSRRVLHRAPDGARMQNTSQNTSRNTILKGRGVT